MSVTTPVDACVSLCDSEGHLVWTSFKEPLRPIGTYVWEYAAKQNQEQVKSAISRVLGLHEPQEYEAADLNGDYYRVWMWPVDLGQVVVSILAIRIPSEICVLSPRERICLHLLAQGHSTGAIAAELDVSLSTVHTHMQRARAKLKLPSIESLIGFAARYSYATETKPVNNAG
jgi:DNA-binding CsgD family transcriptional regulator